MYPIHENESGSFQELAHLSDVAFGQLSILTINPWRVRGGHYHTRNEEWFCCIHGRCMMEIQNVKDYSSRNIVLGEFRKEFVLIKPHESHRLRNLADSICELLVIASRVYNPEDADTYEFQHVEYE